MLFLSALSYAFGAPRRKKPPIVIGKYYIFHCFFYLTYVKEIFNYKYLLHSITKEQYHTDSQFKSKFK